MPQLFPASEMIDTTRMQNLYLHLQHDTQIEQILQITDNTPESLADIGQAMADGDVEEFKRYMAEGKIKGLQGQPVPETNSVWCLYLPPYYIFSDRKMKHE